MHTESHPLAGKTVRLNEMTVPGRPNHDPEPGLEYWIEDWWDHLTGESWQDSDGNPACMMYALRGTGFQSGTMRSLPWDDEVVYGKIGAFGHLVHVSELGGVVE